MKTMKSKFWLISLLLIMIFPAACGPATTTEPSPAETTPPDAGGALEAMPEATSSPPPVKESESASPTEAPMAEPAAGEAYPPPPTTQPMADEYPAPAEPEATIDPYPEAVDGFIWMLLPVGVQCEEDAASYNDLQDAVAGLTAVNVQTGQAEITELTVCSACGCPTSAHYRVQVSIEDVNAAQSLGWTREP